MDQSGPNRPKKRSDASLSASVASSIYMIYLPKLHFIYIYDLPSNFPHCQLIRAYKANIIITRRIINGNKFCKCNRWYISIYVSYDS